MDSLIQTIIPPKPDIDKIKGDLVGRTVSGVDGSYLGGSWYWIIDNCEQIKEAYVTYETQISDSYKYEVHLVLQSEGGKYAVNANLYYVLGGRDDWTLELLESKSVEVVKTGQYDSCITSRHTGWIGEYEVTFTNTCDVPLIVGGLIKYEYRNGWKKFCITVDANGTKSIGGLFFGSISDYKIEFVERL